MHRAETGGTRRIRGEQGLGDVPGCAGGLRVRVCKAGVKCSISELFPGDQELRAEAITLLVAQEGDG